MQEVIRLLTEPDHLMYLAALAAILLSRKDRRWLAVFAVGGGAWIVSSYMVWG